jgi:hypothetical protein
VSTSRRFRAQRTRTHPTAEAHPWNVFDLEQGQVARCPSCGKLAYFRSKGEALVFEREANATSRDDFSARAIEVERLLSALRLAEEAITALLREPPSHGADQARVKQARDDLALIREVTKPYGLAEEAGDG